MGTETDKPSGPERRAEAPMPPVGVPVWVQCKGFRVMAYLDHNGKWRNLATTEEVVGVIKWIKLD